MPPEGSEFCKLTKIPQISSYDCYSHAACAHRNQGVVSQSPLSYLLVIVLCGQTSEHFPGLRPITKIGNQDPSCSIKITLQPLHNLAIARRRSGVQLLKYDRTQP